MARENPHWGYTRIVGALRNLGHKIGRTTIKRIPLTHGLEPAPERGKRMEWKTFLAAHWKVMAATDFFTAEVLTFKGIVTYYCLFFIKIGTREVYVAGITRHPDEPWMKQIARNLTIAESESFS